MQVPLCQYLDIDPDPLYQYLHTDPVYGVHVSTSILILTPCWECMSFSASILKLTARREGVHVPLCQYLDTYPVLGVHVPLCQYLDTEPL